MKKTILFYRDFMTFSGGHLKVWDYFTHVDASWDYIPRVYFAQHSLMDETNPWMKKLHLIDQQWHPDKADVLFIGGWDWRALPEGERTNYPVPVINLIQHIRHAHPTDPRYPFLSCKAIRICVSDMVAQAIQQTGRVNGPVFTIPNGIHFPFYIDTPPLHQRKIEVLIVGLKQPYLAQQLAHLLAACGRNVETIVHLLPRERFLERIANARITVFLPSVNEGFYLPALEGMALGTVVICPDCVGNRQYCQHGTNCLMPRYSAEAISQAVSVTDSMTNKELTALVENGKATSLKHSLASERERFLDLLRNLPRIIREL